jgi:hypothetical protein
MTKIYHLTNILLYAILTVPKESEDKPMDFELIFWIVGGLLALGGLIALALPINPLYDPKGDDPYRYCPKERDDL